MTCTRDGVFTKNKTSYESGSRTKAVRNTWMVLSGKEVKQVTSTTGLNGSYIYLLGDSIQGNNKVKPQQKVTKSRLHR